MRSSWENFQLPPLQQLLCCGSDSLVRQKLDEEEPGHDRSAVEKTQSKDGPRSTSPMTSHLPPAQPAVTRQV